MNSHILLLLTVATTPQKHCADQTHALDSYVPNRKQKYFNNWNGGNYVTFTLRSLVSP